MSSKVDRVRRISLVTMVSLLGIVVLGWVRLAHLPVNVNGIHVRASYGEPISRLAERAGIDCTPGNLVDITGAVLAPGKGAPAVFYLNGRPVQPTDRLFEPGSLLCFPGKDVQERTLTYYEMTEAPPVVTGRGPFVRLREHGACGLIEVREGVVSKRSTRKVLSAPRPTVYEKTDGFGQPVVALTFDDGPSIYTPAILRILASRNVKASFFMIGLNMARLPQHARAVKAAGHTIGNHSYSHPALGQLPYEAVERELRATNALAKKILGSTPQWFRPPRRSLSRAVFAAAQQENMRVVLWDVDPQDWRKPGERAIVSEVLRSTRAGSVILLHDGGGNRTQTVRALPIIIDVLQARGYVFVPLDFFLTRGAQPPLLHR